MYSGTGVMQRRNSVGYQVPLSLTMSAPNTDEWEIPVNKVIMEMKFSEGCFGEVHKGRVIGPIPNLPAMKSTMYINAAIKLLKRKFCVCACVCM